MICSTARVGLSLTMASTVFCDGAGGKPSIVRAATASSTSSLLAAVAVEAGAVSVPSPRARGILSFSSTMMRCAALGPMPFTLRSIRSFSERMAAASSAGVKAESTVRAVWPPILATLMSSRKSSRSCRLAKPNSW